MNTQISNPHFTAIRTLPNKLIDTLGKSDRFLQRFISVYLNSLALVNFDII
ncbi:hypothetical protein [uncultured Nostoc sp.]|uniref:hypothetical protein n=1 Tax=uncultured Nostoc sp. TaxID=340711 RepID=UPI0035CA82D5